MFTIKLWILLFTWISYKCFSFLLTIQISDSSFYMDSMLPSFSYLLVCTFSMFYLLKICWVFWGFFFYSFSFPKFSEQFRAFFNLILFLFMYLNCHVKRADVSHDSQNISNITVKSSYVHRTVSFKILYLILYISVFCVKK